MTPEEKSRIRAARLKIKTEVDNASHVVQSTEHEARIAQRKLREAEDSLKFAEKLLEVFDDNFKEDGEP